MALVLPGADCCTWALLNTGGPLLRPRRHSFEIDRSALDLRPMTTNQELFVRRMKEWEAAIAAAALAERDVEESLRRGAPQSEVVVLKAIAAQRHAIADGLHASVRRIASGDWESTEPVPLPLPAEGRPG